jgi:hypothetical protein
MSVQDMNIKGGIFPGKVIIVEAGKSSTHPSIISDHFALPLPGVLTGRS